VSAGLEGSTSELVQKGFPCEACGSSDAVALYDDGHTHCFACADHRNQQAELTSAANSIRERDPKLAAIMDLGVVRAIPSRGLTQATCEFWDYTTRQNNRGEWEQLAPYRDEHGTLVGVKLRNIGVDGQAKAFSWEGSAKGQLFGRHKWGSGGRMLTILEGEIDTLTVSQCNSHKFPVVGVPNGAAEAAKCIAKNVEWINTFDKVIFGYDMDGPGRQAAVECAKLLPPGKAFIATWDGKDPNEMLKAGKVEAITKAIWNAKPYRPDGIIDARDLTALCLDPIVEGIPWPWEFMTKWTYGRRPREVVTIGAGTGIGKTDALYEIIASTISGKTKYASEYEPEACAVFGYEAGAATTKKAIAGKLWRRRFHIPQDDSGASWTDDELREAMGYMDQTLWGRGGRLFINDSFGAADWQAVIERTRYLVHAEGVKHVFVDPISALVTGEEDERKLLDKLVLEASSLAVELNITVYLMSHLTRPAMGASHEEGGHTRLNQFRGSNGIGMFSHFVFGLERNQQADDEVARCETRWRSLKDRYTGNSLGKTHALVYDVLAGTLDEPKVTFLGDEPLDTAASHGAGH
jgi:twinkle protein